MQAPAPGAVDVISGEANMKLRDFQWAVLLSGTMLCGTSPVFAADDAPHLIRAELTRQTQNTAQAAGDVAAVESATAGAIGRPGSRPTYYGQGYESRMNRAGGRGSSPGNGWRR